MTWDVAAGYFFHITWLDEQCSLSFHRNCHDKSCERSAYCHRQSDAICAAIPRHMCGVRHPRSSSNTRSREGPVPFWWRHPEVALLLSHRSSTLHLRRRPMFTYCDDEFWRPPRVGAWGVTFLQNVHNTHRRAHLVLRNQLPPVCWWHSAVHSD